MTKKLSKDTMELRARRRAYAKKYREAKKAEKAAKPPENLQEETPLYVLPGGGTRRSRAPRYDLVPRQGLTRIANRFEYGASKHGEFNWEKSLDTKEHAAAFCREAYNHMQQHMNNWRNGPNSLTDDLGAIGWGVMAIAKAEDRYGRGFWLEDGR